ncbi:MAG: hypothetical protein CFE33_08910 [Pseudorhodobacter sp. PARRP1]|nr:MAG: hypothetical protein CFE33_08910 [Pseudorhodobacter sp. PARRP1]
MTAKVRIPVIGHVARDIGHDINIVFYILTILVTLMVVAIKAWGIAALVVSYVAMVPVIFALLIWITIP